MEVLSLDMLGYVNKLDLEQGCNNIVIWTGQSSIKDRALCRIKIEVIDDGTE